jgi:hypothetical protein
MVNAINTAIIETGWEDYIRDDLGVRRPNPKNLDLISNFLKRFG